MFRTLPVLLLLALSSTLDLSAQTPLSITGTPRPLQDRALTDELYRWASYTLPTVQLAEALRKGQTSVRLLLGAELDLTLQLQPAQLTAPGYTLRIETEDGLVVQRPKEKKAFKGHVLGREDDRVRLTVDDGFVLGYIQRGAKTYYIETARRFIRDRDLYDVVILYEESQVKPNPNAKCAVAEQNRFHHFGPGRERMSGGCQLVDIALAADYDLVEEQGSVTATENEILGILNAVQGNYDDEFAEEIQFQLLTQFISSCSTCDPWTSSTDVDDLLPDFRSWGNGGGFGTTAFDVASLWSDRNFDGSTIGYAYVGAICSSVRYNINQHFSNNLNLLRVLQAHELGHNFSAQHDASGSPYIMAPSVQNTSQWSAASVNSINNHVNQVSGNCLSGCLPPEPPEANIGLSATDVCVGSQVAFVDLSTGGTPTSWDWSFPGGTPSSSSQPNPVVTYNAPGAYSATLTVSNGQGSTTAVLNTTINVSTGSGTKYLMYETFESGSGQWSVNNPDGEETWVAATIGGTSLGDGAVMVQNYAYNGSGAKDDLISPPLNLSGESSVTLEVDYAYRRYNSTYQDELRIFASQNGGNSFPFLLFEGVENGSGNFATEPDATSEFFPAEPNDWCFGSDFGAGCITLDLSQFIGSNPVVIKIENTNGFGNNMFIDEVRIIGSCAPPDPPTAQFSADEQVGCAPLVVNFTDQSTGTVTDYQWSFPGGDPSTSFIANPTVVYDNPGLYSVSLIASNAAGADELTIADFVQVLGPPQAGFSFGVNGLTANFTNTSTSAGSYVWDFGDGNTSTSPAPSHTYTDPGTYSVTLTAINDCGENSIQQTLTVVPPVEANFTLSDLADCAPQTVTFTDASSGDVISWEWTFDGGSPANSTEQNPSVTYNAPGTYDVTLVVSDGTFSDTLLMEEAVTIAGPPSASFTTDYTVGNTSADFTSSSQNAEVYSWDFGNGQTADGPNAGFDFGADGTYTVLHIATNACGSDTAMQTLTVVTEPTAGFSVDLLSGCAPTQVQFENQSSDNATSFLWSFPGGNPASSTEENPQVVYDQPGTYSVTLEVSNAAGTDLITLPDAVVLGDGPDPAFTFSNDPGQTLVAFSNNSQNADSYLWDFAGLGSSTEADPSFDFPGAGTYAVALTATNGCGSNTFILSVDIVLPPSAHFAADASPGCAPLPVAFTDQSEGNATGWSWSFPGGTPAGSDEPNPVVTYENPGTYAVQLIASNAAGQDTLVLEDLIQVDAPPEAAFSPSNTLGETVVDFANASTGATDYIWDFAGLGSSTEAEPSFDFPGDGDYPVQLIALNPCGSDTLIQTVTLVTAPEAGFTSSNASGCAPLAVQFSDQSSDNATSWTWSFPGGTPASSNQPSPTVNYDQPGVYDVQLVVSNAAGADTLLQTAWVEVLDLPSADFSFVQNGTVVQFSNASASGSSFLWDFGDGTTSTEEEPVHNYEEEGDYALSLTVSNACGSDTAIDSLSVLFSLPTADFTADATTGCAPLTVAFFNASSADTESVEWTFEGGAPATSTSFSPVVTFNEPGTYTVTLKASNSSGSSTVSKMDYIQVNPQPEASFTVDANGPTVQFANTSSLADSYLWLFGDGDSSTAVFPQHTYTGPGPFDVMLIAFNACGQDTAVQQLNLSGSAPQAGFGLAGEVGCAPASIQFLDESQGPVESWSWTFAGADPAASTESDPLVAFPEPGLYPVSLTVQNAWGSSTFTDTLEVLGLPLSAFNYSADGLEVQFFNQSSGGSLSFDWRFGDGNGSSQFAPLHSYADEGLYPVQLIAGNACGLDTLRQDVDLRTVATSSVQDDFTARLFPNPSDGRFRLEGQGWEGEPEARLRLLNALGQTMALQRAVLVNGTLQEDLDWSHLPAGWYLLQVQTVNQQWQARLLFQKR